jgi:asparagine synthase (glutamine-hydrolysing)
MQAALRRILATAERPVFDLTGGYDTRNVLATALSLGVTPTTTVVGMPDSRDVVAANRIAATFGLTHHHYVPGRDLPEPGFADLEAAVPLTDGEISALEYASIAIVQRRTSEGFDLNVNGTFGELCRGYWWDALLPWVGKRDGFDARDFAAKRFAVDGWADAMTKGLNADTLLDHFTREVEHATAGLAGHPNTAGADACYYTIRMQRWGGRIASSTLHIRPFASPFFFLETMRPALSAPLLRRFGGRMAASLVERLKPDLAALPMADGYPALPLRLGTLPRFAPLGVDLATRAARKVMTKLTGRHADHVPGAVAQGFDARQLPEVADLLAPGGMKTRALYDAAALDAFLEGARAGRPVAKGQIGRVITLELVARRLAGVG